MSKNIVIQEGGIGKQLTVDKLKTNLVGGSCLWVPEVEINLGMKSISENGTYKASDDGYYGYSEVTVNGVGSVTGRDPTTGEEVEVHRDPTTGEIVETPIPTEISVIEPPTNPYGIYQNGQTITKDGMVVKAYGANGSEMQTVPIGEITINPTVAVYDPATDTGGWSDGTSEDVPENIEPPQPIRYSGSVTARKETYNAGELTAWEEKTITAPCVTAWFKTNGAVVILYAASSSFSVTIKTDRWSKSSGSQSSTDTYIVNYNTTVNEKTVYYGSTSGGGYTQLSIDAGHGERYDEGYNQYVAYVMVYGDAQVTPKGSRQTITASWPRSRDGKVLTDTFEILVAPGYTQNGEE